MTEAKQQEKSVRPDLRKAPGSNRVRQMILAACVLATIYMYPTIIRPLFGIGASADRDEAREKMQEINKALAKHRPDNMPDWTSPFGPKKRD